MALDRITITVDAEVGADIRAAAEEAGMSVSAWIVDACADLLRNHRFGKYLDEYEAEHGAFTEEELDEAAREMGITRTRRRKR